MGQRPLGCLSESLRMSLGSFLEASWGVLEASWRSQGPLGASWVLRGASWGLLETAGRLWGACWDSWGPWGAFGGPLGGLSEACWRPRRGLLGASSWFLEPLGTFVGASLSLLGPIGGEKARRGKSLISIRFYKLLPCRKRSVLQGLLGPSGALGLSGASLEASGTSLGPSETRRCRLGGGSGPPWAAWTAD